MKKFNTQPIEVKRFKSMRKTLSGLPPATWATPTCDSTVLPVLVSSQCAPSPLGGVVAQERDYEDLETLFS
jgi:hypothetical protein